MEKDHKILIVIILITLLVLFLIQYVDEKFLYVFGFAGICSIVYMVYLMLFKKH